METMKAVRIHSYGGVAALKYEDAPIPKIKDNNGILIRVHSAGVNPIDWKIRQGYLAGLGEHELPLTLGWDFAGTILEVGKGIETFKVGEAVFGHPSLSHNGAYAEYILAYSNEIARKPSHLTYIEASVIPLSSLTAWQALFDYAKLSEGQKILIHAAAGGVGHYAVQFAKWKKAHVIGTGSVTNKKFLEELGVDEFIDYKSQDFTQIVKDVDVVFDTLGGEVRLHSWEVLKNSGILVSIVDRRGETEKEAKKFNRHGKSFVVTPNSHQLNEIAKLADEGIIKPYIQKILPLKEAAKAHELSEGKHVHGKIALEVYEGNKK